MRRSRFGYRRLHVMLKREGLAVNHKKLFRLYREQAKMRALLMLAGEPPSPAAASLFLSDRTPTAPIDGLAQMECLYPSGKSACRCPRA